MDDLDARLESRCQPLGSTVECIDDEFETRHAGADTLDALDSLLVALREREALKERKRGTFYRKSAAFLHFHEDPAGIFADLKIDGLFQRFRVSTPEEQEGVLRKVDEVLGAPAKK